MNKKTIFISLLLLAIQPNKILGADNDFVKAKQELESYLNTAKEFGDNPDISTVGKFTSGSTDVDRLLEITRTSIPDDKRESLRIIDAYLAGDGKAPDSYYYPRALDIIKRHYGDIDLKTMPLVGAGIKRAKQ